MEDISPHERTFSTVSSKGVRGLSLKNIWQVFIPPLDLRRSGSKTCGLTARQKISKMTPPRQSIKMSFPHFSSPESRVFDPEFQTCGGLSGPCRKAARKSIGGADILCPAVTPASAASYGLRRGMSLCETSKIALFLKNNKNRLIL